jgi:hypothetical protein
MWHVFTVRIEEKPGGWKVHSNREVATFAGQERVHGKDLVAALKIEGYLGSKVIFSENEAGPGQTAVYVLHSSADVPKLAATQFLIMGIGNGPSGADWPMMALEWKA